MISRNSSRKTPLVLQGFSQKKTVYIPTFLEYQSTKLKMSLSELKRKYYIFGMSQSIKVEQLELDTIQLSGNLRFSVEGVELDLIRHDGGNLLWVATPPEM